MRKAERIPEKIRHVPHLFQVKVPAGGSPRSCQIKLVKNGRE